MKVLSTDGLTKLIQLIKSAFISVDDTVSTNSVTLATVATSGSYNDLTDKPTIPSAVTESTVSGWGFTKNTGTVTSVNNVQPVNGNVTLPSEVFIAEYNVTSYFAIKEAYNAGKAIYCKYATFYIPLVQATNNVQFSFNGTVLSDETIVMHCTIRNTWSLEITQLESVSNKVTSISSSSTDTQYPSALAVLNLLQAIYPIGSVYLSTNSTCPLASLFGTWTLVSSGRALWTGTGSNGGSTISAGLPNIIGTVQGVWNGTCTDAMYEATHSGDLFDRSDGGGKGAWGTLSFSANSSNTIYGNNTTVQPPAYVVNVWRRTA